jgi:hypothetical protein
MADISISLSNVRNIKTVRIEELGVFTVRRLGPGEEYDLSIKRRRLAKIGEEMSEIKSEMDAIEDEKDREKFATSHLAKINQLSDEITDIQKYELDVYKRCFTDEANGQNTDKLINSLTADERLKLYSMIFDKNTTDGDEK